MTFFFNYFLFARSRIQNWRKNTPIWQKIQKKLNFAEFMEFVFSKSDTNMTTAKHSYTLVEVFFFRPVLNESEPLKLTFGVTLQQIIDVVRKKYILFFS